MMMNSFPSDPLDFKQLLVRILGNERQVQVEFLIALAEFDLRELYLELGYSTLWDFCMKELHFCKGSTFRRTHSVAMIQRFPQLATILRDGKLCMTTMVELEGVLTNENFDSLTEQAAFKTKEEVEQIVAAMRQPTELPRDSVRRAPQWKGAIQSPPAEMNLVLPEPETPIGRPEASRPIRFEPVSAEDWFMHAKLSDRVMTKFRRSRELASHSIPNGEWEDVLEAALDCFIAEQEKRRAAKTDKPRKTSKVSKDPRYISAEVKRIVSERDGDACTWRGPDGHVCGSKWQVEFDHIDPDGPSTLDNLRLLCRNHNRLHAEHCYGKEHMDQFTRKPGSAGGTRVTEVTWERTNHGRATREKQATETLQSRLDFHVDS